MSDENGESKSSKKDRKDKKDKNGKKEKKKEVKEVHVKSAKANPKGKIIPTTGTRFEPNSARQLAFDIVLRMVKDSKDAKEIREKLANTRKDKDAKFNLDVGYLNFVVASHPEMFTVWNNGKIDLLKEPKIDKEAAQKYEDEKAAKKRKAEKAREERKKKAKGEKEDKEKKDKKNKED